MKVSRLERWPRRRGLLWITRSRYRSTGPNRLLARPWVTVMTFASMSGSP